MGIFKKNKERGKPRKATGEDKLYFILHNLISMSLFLIVIWRYDLYNSNFATFFAFLRYYGILLFLTILFSLITRLLVYAFLWFYYDSEDKTMKSFGDINQGINSFLSYPYFIQTILSTLVFAIWGKLFTQEPWETTMIAYILIKVGISLYGYIKYK
jgi:hypothetical protein